MANTCVLVIGPCRSGTSICSGLLNQLGCDMGGQGEISAWNPKGNYSDPEFDYLLRCVSAEPTNSSFTVQLGAYLKLRDALPIWGLKHYLLAGPLISWMTTSLKSSIKVVYTSRNAVDSANSLNALRGGNGVANTSDTAFITKMNSWIATAQVAGGVLASLPSMTVAYDSIFNDPAGTVANLATFAGLPNNPALASWIDSSLQMNSVAVAAQLFGSVAGTSAPALTPGDCIHLGLPVLPPGQRTDQEGKVCECRGKWLMKCDLHTECTISVARPEVSCCQTCPDYCSQSSS